MYIYIYIYIWRKIDNKVIQVEGVIYLLDYRVINFFMYRRIIYSIIYFHIYIYIYIYVCVFVCVCVCVCVCLGIL